MYTLIVLYTLMVPHTGSWDSHVVFRAQYPTAMQCQMSGSQVAARTVVPVGARVEWGCRPGY